VERAGGTVKVAFFRGLSNLRRIQEPRQPIGSHVRVAALVDLAGMKMRVIQMRGSWKDYIDIHSLVSNGIDINGPRRGGRNRCEIRPRHQHSCFAILW